MKTKLLIFLSLFFHELLVAQSEDYLIFNVIVKDNFSHTGSINNSFWITKIEDIDNVKTSHKILPLYLLDDLSKDAIVDCLSSKEIDLFTTTFNTDRNFEDKFIAELTSLNLLLEEKVLLQKITKTWKNKRKVKVSVYVTPISGVFNVCNATSSMKEKFDIPENIVIPNSNFKLLDFAILERGNIAEFLSFLDFSKYSLANRVW